MPNRFQAVRGRHGGSVAVAEEAVDSAEAASVDSVAAEAAVADQAEGGDGCPPP